MTEALRALNSSRPLASSVSEARRSGLVSMLGPGAAVVRAEGKPLLVSVDRAPNTAAGADVWCGCMAWLVLGQGNGTVQL